jgi:hypothetical protein
VALVGGARRLPARVLRRGLRGLPVLQLIDSEDLATIVASLVASFVIVAASRVWLQRTQPGWPAVMGLPVRWAAEIRAGVLWASPCTRRGLRRRAHAQPPAQGDLGDVVGSEQIQAPVLVRRRRDLFYGVVIAPIGEEFFFRGVLFRSIRDRHGFWAGALGSGVAFGLIHYMQGPGLNAILLMSVMVFTGIGLAWIYERRGTIVAPMMAHVTFNVIGVVLIYALR